MDENKPLFIELTPEIFAKYEKILPGARERILKMIDKEREHRLKMKELEKARESLCSSVCQPSKPKWLLRTIIGSYVGFSLLTLSSLYWAHTDWRSVTAFIAAASIYPIFLLLTNSIHRT